jgi:hypothetical protein
VEVTTEFAVVCVTSCSLEDIYRNASSNLLTAHSVQKNTLLLLRNLDKIIPGYT